MTLELWSPSLSEINVRLSMVILCKIHTFLGTKRKYVRNKPLKLLSDEKIYHISTSHLKSHKVYLPFLFLRNNLRLETTGVFNPNAMIITVLN